MGLAAEPLEQVLTEVKAFASVEQANYLSRLLDGSATITDQLELMQLLTEQQQDAGIPSSVARVGEEQTMIHYLANRAASLDLQMKELPEDDPQYAALAGQFAAVDQQLALVTAQHEAGINWVSGMFRFGIGGTGGLATLLASAVGGPISIAATILATTGLTMLSDSSILGEDYYEEGKHWQDLGFGALELGSLGLFKGLNMTKMAPVLEKVLGNGYRADMVLAGAENLAYSTLYQSMTTHMSGEAPSLQDFIATSLIVTGVNGLFGGLPRGTRQLLGVSEGGLADFGIKSGTGLSAWVAQTGLQNFYNQSALLDAERDELPGQATEMLAYGLGSGALGFVSKTMTKGMSLAVGQFVGIKTLIDMAPAMGLDPDEVAAQLGDMKFQEIDPETGHIWHTRFDSRTNSVTLEEVDAQAQVLGGYKVSLTEQQLSMEQLDSQGMPLQETVLTGYEDSQTTLITERDMAQPGQPLIEVKTLTPIKQGFVMHSYDPSLDSAQLTPAELAKLEPLRTEQQQRPQKLDSSYGIQTTIGKLQGSHWVDETNWAERPNLSLETNYTGPQPTTPKNSELNLDLGSGETIRLVVNHPNNQYQIILPYESASDFQPFKVNELETLTDQLQQYFPEVDPTIIEATLHHPPSKSE